MMPTAPMNAALAGASQATSLLTSKLINDMSPEGQAMNRKNQDDLRRLGTNNFGPSRSQQERAVADAMAQVRAQSAGALAEAQRAKAAQAYRAPDATTAKIVQGTQQQAGALRMQVADSAAQQARQAQLDALQRVKARSDQTVADVRSVRDEGHKAYMGSEGGATGGMDSKTGEALPSAYGLGGRTFNQNAYGG